MYFQNEGRTRLTAAYLPSTRFRLILCSARQQGAWAHRTGLLGPPCTVAILHSLYLLAFMALDQLVLVRPGKHNHLFFVCYPTQVTMKIKELQGEDQVPFVTTLFCFILEGKIKCWNCLITSKWTYRWFNRTFWSWALSAK